MSLLAVYKTVKGQKNPRRNIRWEAGSGWVAEMSGTDGLCRPSLSAAQFTRKVFGYLLVTLSTGAVIDLSQSGCLTVRACVQLE